MMSMRIAKLYIRRLKLIDVAEHFSVDSETRNLKHAYAMGARNIANFLIWTLIAFAHATGRTQLAEESESTESIETTTERQNKRLKNIVSLQENCETTWNGFRYIANCQGFQFDNPDEVAFVELPTKVTIATDGATYELGEDQHLSVLTITNSTFFNFPLHLFYNMPLLRELDMRNCGLRQLTWECFLAADKLQIMLLSDNELVELTESIFSYASNLEFLFLSNNKLSSLHPQAFRGLPLLNHLDLSGNQLEQLPEGIFDELPALEQLTLSENRLRFISNDLLANNPRLHTVLLSTNQLRELGENAFRSVEHLLVLELSHNPQLEVLVLSLHADHLLACNCALFRVNLFGACANVDFSNNRLQELYFSQSEALEQLVLRNNSLQQLVTLQRVPRLRNLNVADNRQLGELPADWQTPELQQLDLSNTGLKELPLVALRGMPQLRKLNVSVNNLSEIDPQAFPQLSQLTHFFIHKNNWNCFNLRILMDLVILSNNITYVIDDDDAYFPGEYLNGISCMYRMPELEQEPEELQKEQLMEYVPLGEPNEVYKLRQEFKAVVQHLELRLDAAFEQLSNLNKKMQFLEQMNSTMWQQMGIIV